MYGYYDQLVGNEKSNIIVLVAEGSKLQKAFTCPARQDSLAVATVSYCSSLVATGTWGR